MAKNTGKSGAVPNLEIPPAALVTKASAKERAKTKSAAKGVDANEGLNAATQRSV